MFEEDLIELAKEVLRAVKVDGAETVIIHEDSSLTRYANSIIHQNVKITNLRVGIRVRRGKKAAVAWSDREDKDGILNLVRKAEASLEHMPEDPELPPLLSPQEYKRVAGYVEATAETTPEERGKVVAQVIEDLKPFLAFGAFTTGKLTIVLANTEGLIATHTLTDAHLSINARSDTGSGWAQDSSSDVRKIDHIKLAGKARRKAELSSNPVDIKPGVYPVILEELAIGEIFSYMAYLGFSAKAYQEGRSCFINRLGTQVFDPKLDAEDDPFSIEGFPMPFDLEGVPKKPMKFIEKGVPKVLAYDLKTALREGKSSSGHAASPLTSVPYPLHLLVKPGDVSLDDLIKKTERAILVTRLHYTNISEPMSLTLTGMTRDGTFWIENGRITKALKNLRYTQGMLDALSNIEAITTPSRLVSETSWYGVRFPSGYRVPAMKLPKFAFTGATEF